MSNRCQCGAGECPRKPCRNVGHPWTNKLINPHFTCGTPIGAKACVHQPKPGPYDGEEWPEGASMEKQINALQARVKEVEKCLFQAQEAAKDLLRQLKKAEAENTRLREDLMWMTFIKEAIAAWNKREGEG